MDQPLLAAHEFTYYRPHPRGFKLIPYQRLWSAVWFLVFGTMTVMLGYEFFFFHIYEAFVLMIVPLSITFFSLGQLGKVVIFDTAKQVIKVYYFGGMTSKNVFTDFIGFITSASYVRKLYTGTEVVMMFTTKKVVIGKFRDSAKIEQLKKETKLIMDGKMLLKK